MVEIGTFQVNEVRSWLGIRLGEAASWREAKAADYPDDARNSHSAAALHAAAHYTRTVDQRRSQGLVHVTRVIETARQSGIDLLAPAFATAPFPGFESQRVANRFGFDNLPGAPDDVAQEEFLRDLGDAILRDLRERLFELEKDSPLARLLRAKTAPTTPADATLAALTELVDLLREGQTATERTRRLDRVAEISALVATVRDVAIAEAAANGSLQGLETGSQIRTFPQTRKQLHISLVAYKTATGSELPACLELATGSTMMFKEQVVGGATNAFDELLAEADGGD